MTKSNLLNGEHTFIRPISIHPYGCYPITITKYNNDNTVQGYYNKNKLTLVQKLSLSN